MCAHTQESLGVENVVLLHTRQGDGACTLLCSFAVQFCCTLQFGEFCFQRDSWARQKGAAAAFLVLSEETSRSQRGADGTKAPDSPAFLGGLCLITGEAQMQVGSVWTAQPVWLNRL